MIYKDFVNSIEKKASELFVAETDSASGSLFLEIAPQVLKCKNVLRVKRKNEDSISEHSKTILITSLKNPEEITQALLWASAVKEEITDPESADLYLIVHFEEAVALDVCLRIESTEQFCRKYTLRTNEKMDQFLERTFLNQIKKPSSESFGTDPLRSAFSKVADDNITFTKKEQEKWKDLLLSGLNGIELISELFANPSSNKNES